MIRHELAYAEPQEVADKLRHAEGFAFLDSGGADLETGRYSFIGLQPFASFRIEAGQAFWNDTALEGPPLAHLRTALARYATAPAADGPPLQSGCIGHLSYDLGQSLERLAAPTRRAPHSTDLRFGFYDVICAFDRQARRFWICSSGLPETAPDARARRAGARLAETLARLDGPAPAALPAPPGIQDWRSNFTAESYGAAIEALREHIRCGDIYQANLAQRFEAALPPGFDPWALYQRLRRTNPAPFAAYLRDGDTTFASSSPERFLSLREGRVEARPIKGTCRRHPDPSEDAARAAALLASEKDRAENVMIVDLLRNDMSRVCAPGSVEVPVLCGLESYASVHHLTSVVTGRLRDGLGPVDLIEACFPGGSITGAPKIRAMDILTEQEGIARGIYCGSIGYIGFDGAMDLNIAIRTAVLGDGRAVVQAGGGITLLSDPGAEYTETLDKAERLFAAFADAP
ncbi:aminodeoxychorismate synthase component I [Pseudooceanicola sp. CBS1P-1]|uniref:aminodeoxychorismate synthase n=1 Tax=Pseudooceanicola albus TaxID=2692189 RepID=A0A6L7G0Z7_9RHOB|nr:MULTISPECIES: aminodeoxychorismate synthase component I [Pseudooceanicola]MBT9383755.1 aminodeoxychorismate synthase component I [Pseudooceanicola endophyticus]MXN17609.1 aminodeoxychorismate synthase component I [Pseudooceanicola albus]